MLIRLLDDKNPHVRDVALKSFWNMAGHYQFLHESAAGCIERLIRLTAHTNSKVRCKSIRLLGRVRPSRKIDALLVKLLDDGDAMVSMYAVIPLLELADWRDRLVREATPGLVGNLGRYHWWASQDAMRLLRRFTGKKFRRKAEWQTWHKSGAK